MSKKVVLGSVVELTPEQFTEHDPSAGGGGAWLKDWKERGKIVVWPHPAAKLVSVWRHSWYTEDVRSDEDGGDNPLKTIVYTNFPSFENERVNSKQFFIDKESGEREHPPIICPFAIMLDWVRLRIFNGELDMCEELFKFGDDEDAKIVYAGGALGMFNSRKLSDKERERIRKKTGVTQDKAFQQNMRAQQQYLMAVVPHDPEVGTSTVIAQLAAGLGKEIKSKIDDRVNDLGEQEGRYNNTPHAFEWRYHKDRTPDKRYEAKPRTITDSFEMPEHVTEAFSQDPPDIRGAITPYDLHRFRLELEKFSVIEMPIAEFFRPIEEHFEIDTTQSEMGDEEEEEEAPAKKRPSEVKGKTKAVEEEEEEAEAEEESDDDVQPYATSECSVCQAPMADTDTKCKKCGSEYEIRTDEKDGKEYLFVSARRCANPACKKMVTEIDNSGEGTCKHCGAIHDAEWSYTVPNKARPAKMAPKVARRK